MLPSTLGEGGEEAVNLVERHWGSSAGCRRTGEQRLLDREGWKQLAPLRNEREAATDDFARLFSSGHPSIERDAARVRRREADDRFHYRRLTGSIGTEKRERSLCR